jgi:hypothetical protein
LKAFQVAKASPGRPWHFSRQVITEDLSRQVFSDRARNH